MYRLFYSGFFAIAVILIVSGSMPGRVFGQVEPHHTDRTCKSLNNDVIFESYCDIEENYAEIKLKASRQLILSKASTDASIEIVADSFTQLIPCIKYSSIGNVELCLIDNQNRKTGYDIKNKNTINQIPDSYYTRHLLSGLSDPIVIGPLSKIVGVNKTSNGNYELQVIGTKSGGYELCVFLNDQKFNHERILNPGRIISSGIIHHYLIDYNISNAVESKITKKVSPQEIKSSLQTAFSLAWIDDKNTLNDLVTKIERTDSAVKRGKRDSAINILQTFINDVGARKGKHIAGTVADILIDDAKSLINQLQE
jgi:hypothetical protein